jgi:tetratricopeptide (TPR) repeat protein
MPLSPPSKETAPNATLDEATERFFQKLLAFLDLASGSAFAIARCNLPSLRKEILQRVATDAAAKGVTVKEVDISSNYSSDFVAAVKAQLDGLPTGSRMAVMLNGIDGLIYQSASQGNLLGEGRTPFIARLNFDRERIARDLPFPIVLWLESESLTLLLKQAPDFTQWISGHFHFGGPAAEAKALDRLFEVYKSLPSQPAAETRKQLEEFSGLLQELNETRGSGDAVTLRKRLAVLGALGERYYRLSDFRMAQKHWTEALQIARKLNDRRAESSVLGNLGLAYAALGEAHRAIEFYKNQLVIAREIGDRCGEGAATGNLGNAYRQLGDTRRAIEFYEKQLMITREIGDRRGEGNALGSLGMAYGALGDTRRAIEFYEQRLAIAREIEDPRGEGSSLFNMGLALDKLGDRTQAIARAEAALRIFEQIEDPNAAKVR